jgi:hypothetical protein
MNFEQCKHYKALQFFIVLLKDLYFSNLSSNYLHLFSALSKAKERFLFVSYNSTAESFELCFIPSILFFFLIN